MKLYTHRHVHYSVSLLQRGLTLPGFSDLYPGWTGGPTIHGHQLPHELSLCVCVWDDEDRGLSTDTGPLNTPFVCAALPLWLACRGDHHCVNLISHIHHDMNNQNIHLPVNKWQLICFCCLKICVCVYTWPQSLTAPNIVMAFFSHFFPLHPGSFH